MLSTSDRVAAVIVTHNRLELLQRSLSIVANQTRPVDWVIVVDNGHDPAVGELLEKVCAEAQANRAAQLAAVQTEATAAPSTAAGGESVAPAPSTTAAEKPGAAPSTAVPSENVNPAPSTSVPSGNAAVASSTLDGPRAVYLPSHANLGGAGGFAYGFLTALALGADAVFCADDDGQPEDTEVLAKLYQCAMEHGLEQVSPTVANINQPEKFAFPVRQGTRWLRWRNEVDPANAYLPNYSSLFNGALISRRAIDRIGVPDARLFIRGDEVEYYRRLSRSGYKYGTCLTAAYLHPDGTDEFRPILGGRMYTQYPDNPTKRYFTYRNRGFLINQPGFRRLFPQEILRFGWFFLVQRRDPRGFVEWFRLLQKGRREQFGQPE